MKKILIFAGLIVITAGCYWDNVETMLPENELCDTLQVSFSSDVVPILTNNCYSCHSNSNAPAFASGLSLEDHEDVAAYSYRIIGSINHREGFLPMPKDQEQLDSCQVKTMEAWVNQGKLNN